MSHRKPRKRQPDKAPEGLAPDRSSEELACGNLRRQEITESYELPIEGKILSLAVIRKLATVLSEESAKDNAECRSLDFSVACDDSSSFKSNDIRIFDEGSVINRRRVTRVEMMYWPLGPSAKKIDIQLNHGGWRWLPNRMVVAGRDNVWVNGIAAKLRDILDAAPPQWSHCKLVKKLIWSLIPTALGLVYFAVLRILLKDIPIPANREDDLLIVALDKVVSVFPYSRHIIYYVFCYFLGGCFGGWLLALRLVDKLTSLWPSVELQIGPEHMLTEPKQRKWLTGFMLATLIPILVSVTYDLIKAIVRWGS